MSRIEKVTFTNMCMITDGRGNVLVENRLDPDWPGIAFPGGHVEIGESFVDAVTREVLEETGLKVSNLTHCGIKDWADVDRWPRSSAAPLCPDSRKGCAPPRFDPQR